MIMIMIIITINDMKTIVMKTDPRPAGPCLNNTLSIYHYRFHYYYYYYYYYYY